MSDCTPQTIEFQIPQGYIVFIEAIDSELALRKWSIQRSTDRYISVKRTVRIPNAEYIEGTPRYRKEWLHRVIMERVLGRKLTQDEEVDHINGDTLDNRRANLRVVTRTQNNQNARRRKDNTSGYKGVVFNKLRGKWFAQIQINKKRYRRDGFDSPGQAHMAYLEMANLYSGEYTRAA